jgi:hypothetical protein
MRTSFHHQPEAQHPNFQLSTSWQADYPIFRGHRGHQPSELSARPPSLAISLPVALLGGLSLGGLLLLELALALLGLGDLSSVVLEDAAVTLLDVCPRRRFVDKERVRRHRGEVLQRQVRLRRRPPQLARRVGRRDAQSFASAGVLRLSAGTPLDRRRLRSSTCLSKARMSSRWLAMRLAISG